jgi:XRE family transcriptional regulator, regulator of sulfur utilization
MPNMLSPDTDCGFIVSFGSTVRQLREQQGWSQEALAERADLNRSYVGELERGKAIPSLLTLKKLAGALDLSLTNLMAHTERSLQNRLVRSIELTSIAC